MKASLLLLGPSIPHTQLRAARLVDIAPTIASWLSLPERAGGYDGKPLNMPEQAPVVPANVASAVQADANANAATR
ncbi:MAG: hypothetical protein RL701_5920 [Pseudomonadota bacterium]|jgi:hypothetical protein